MAAQRRAARRMRRACDLRGAHGQVGTACRVVRVIWQRPADGASLVEVVGTRRVVLSGRRLAPAPGFGLWVAAAAELKDDPVPPGDAAAASAMAAVAAEMFAQLMRAQLEAAAESVAAAAARGGGANEERLRERLAAAVEAALRKVCVWGGG
jgi:Lon protease-like protein